MANESIGKRAWNFKDLTGMEFGRLTVETYSHTNGKKAMWDCLCSCGNRAVVSSVHLQRKDSPTRSCGCLHAETVRTATKTHGLTGTPEHIVWNGMKARCRSRWDYAGRGIKVCERWLESFENFLSDMGPRPSAAHTIDRIDGRGNYEPGNCRWATKQEQSRNRKSNRVYVWNGTPHFLSDLAKQVGMGLTCLRKNIEKYGIEKAMTMPPSRQYLVATRHRRDKCKSA